MPHFKNLDLLRLPPRPADAQEQLIRILTALVEDYGAEKIIVFGSCVRGTATEHSDVDLCVIRRHPPGCTHPGLEADLAVSRIHPLVSTDILVRTPEEWKEKQEHPFGVFEEVVHHGLAVYER